MLKACDACADMSQWERTVTIRKTFRNTMQYPQRYLVLRLVGLELPLLSRLGLADLACGRDSLKYGKYRCEYGTLNSNTAGKG